MPFAINQIPALVEALRELNAKSTSIMNQMLNNTDYLSSPILVESIATDIRKMANTLDRIQFQLNIIKELK